MYLMSRLSEIQIESRFELLLNNQSPHTFPRLVHLKKMSNTKERTSFSSSILADVDEKQPEIDLSQDQELLFRSL